MARIVLTSWGSYGDLYPFIGLALALRARGHTPLLALPAAYQPLVEAEGLAFTAAGPDVDVHDRALAARIMNPATGTDVVFGEILLPALARTHADLMRVTADADLLITHPAAPAGVIVAEERRMRWASAVLAPISFFSATDPVVPPPAPWIHAWLARSAWLAQWFLRLTDRITRKWAAPIQDFREGRGLPRGGNPLLAAQHSPHLVLALFSKSLAAPQPDWPANVCVAGPVLYNGVGSSTLPEDLARFLDDGEPPVVFTLGTSAVMAAGGFYEASAAAMASTGRRAVLLVGPHAENQPRTSSGRIFLAPFAPHHALFPRASVVVHQGGAGTLHQALVAGHPAIVVPHAHDQPDNARRVAALGVARTIYPRQYTATRLARELRTLAETPAYAERAAAVAASVRQERGAETAAAAVDALLG